MNWQSFSWYNGIMVHVFTGIFFVIIIFYAAFILLLYRAQRHLIYHPQKPIHAPEHYGLTGFVEHSVNTPDNETLQLWYRKAANGFPTVIYFHGNASNMGNRAG